MTADASTAATPVVPVNNSGGPREQEAASGPAHASTLDRLLAAGSIDFSHVSGPRDDTVRDFLAFAIQVTALAGQLHRQGAIHGAITPAVIVLNAEGEVVAIYPSEQGAPGAAEVPDSSEPEALPYGLAYRSPELTGRMNRLVDHRTDLYSLGISIDPLE